MVCPRRTSVLSTQYWLIRRAKTKEKMLCGCASVGNAIATRPQAVTLTSHAAAAHYVLPACCAIRSISKSSAYAAIFCDISRYLLSDPISRPCLIVSCIRTCIHNHDLRVALGCRTAVKPLCMRAPAIKHASRVTETCLR